jgi:hypothetical protein
MTFGGQDLYPTMVEKAPALGAAAHFVVVRTWDMAHGGIRLRDRMEASFHSWNCESTRAQ